MNYRNNQYVAEVIPADNSDTAVLNEITGLYTSFNQQRREELERQAKKHLAALIRDIRRTTADVSDKVTSQA